MPGMGMEVVGPFGIILRSFWINFKTILGPPMPTNYVFQPKFNFLEMAHISSPLFDKDHPSTQFGQKIIKKHVLNLSKFLKNTHISKFPQQIFWGLLYKSCFCISYISCMFCKFFILLRATQPNQFYIENKKQHMYCLSRHLSVKLKNVSRHVDLLMFLVLWHRECIFSAGWSRYGV